MGRPGWKPVSAVFSSPCKILRRTPHSALFDCYAVRSLPFRESQSHEPAQNNRVQNRSCVLFLQRQDELDKVPEPEKPKISFGWQAHIQLVVIQGGDWQGPKALYTESHGEPWEPVAKGGPGTYHLEGVWVGGRMHPACTQQPSALPSIRLPFYTRRDPIRAPIPTARTLTCSFIPSVIPPAFS